MKLLPLLYIVLALNSLKNHFVTKNVPWFLAKRDKPTLLRVAGFDMEIKVAPTKPLSLSYNGHVATT